MAASLLLVSPSSATTHSTTVAGVNVSVDFMTPHAEIYQGENVELKCVVTITEETLPKDIVWMFFPSPEYDNDEEDQTDDAGRGDHGSPDEILVVASDGKIAPDLAEDQFDGGSRVSVKVRQSFNFVNSDLTEEQILKVTKLQLVDQGMYMCQVKTSALPERQWPTRHTLLSVRPESFRENAHPMLPTLMSSHLTRGPPREDADGEERPTLGPVTERYVVVAAGENVVLECHDADDNWVYWQKQGDPDFSSRGRRLRLFRVDRWDSGLYYCSTNTSLK